MENGKTGLKESRVRGAKGIRWGIKNRGAKAQRHRGKKDRGLSAED